MSMEADTVFVIDGYDQFTDTAFCEVFADKAKARARAAKITEEYGLDAESQETFFAVGVVTRKVR